MSKLLTIKDKNPKYIKKMKQRKQATKAIAENSKLINKEFQKSSRLKKI